MFERKKNVTRGPVLLDRVVTSGTRRVAVVGLHSGAGARTVLAALVKDVRARSWPFAVTAVPGLPIESEDEAGGTAVVPLTLPEGAVFATATRALADAADAADVIDELPFDTQLGRIVVARALREREFGLRGPTEPDAMRRLADSLAEASGGLVFIEGAWERRAFASPGTCDGMILVVGAGFSPTPQRAAAAARYVVETLSIPPCDEPARVAWHETASKGAAVMLDGSDRPCGLLPPGLDDPVPAMRARDGSPVATVVLPSGLNDEFMIPLVRSRLRCTLVVRDATRLNLSPVYFKAWLKGRGRIQAVHATRLVAVATNPFNPLGPDADAEDFRRTVANALPELDTHDVRLEWGDEGRRSMWKFWE